MEEKRLMKRLAAVFLAFALIFTSFALLSPADAMAGFEMEVKSPQAGATVMKGKAVQVSVDPAMVSYLNNNYLQLQILKGGTQEALFNIMYTDLSTIETSFTPKGTGTYTIKAGYSPMEQSTMYDSAPTVIKITVIDPTKAVKNMKPSINTFRFTNKLTVISWKPFEGASLKIYRATKKKGKYKLIKSSNGESCEDTGLKARTYYYKARWCIKSGSKKYYSKYSAIKKVTTSGIPKITSLKYIAGKGVKLKWTKSSYASRYFIMRGDDFIGETGPGKTSFVDKTAVKGKTYKYEIKAYNDKQERGKASDIKKIKVPK